MSSQYVPGVIRGQYDQKITKIFNECDAPATVQGMTIGIQNEEGQLYRVLIVFGQVNYLLMTEALADLGLKDINARLRQVVPDSLFVHPK